MSETAELLVLHVDAEPGFADGAAEHLERENSRFVVETATSASQGLERLVETDVDCIVSDYQLPGMDGIEFLDTVRKDYPDLPFVLFTGKGSEEIASEAISTGVTDYLRKESSTSQFELLADRIESAVERYRARTGGSETEERLCTIAEHSNDILWEFTDDWSELLFINSPYEEVWGRSIAELREDPRSFLRGIHPDDRSRVREAMERLSAGESVDIEYRVNADEDFGRWVWVQGEPVFDDSGEVERVVGFARDVTERKEHERELQQTRSRMEFALNAVDAVVWDWNAEADRAVFYPSEETLYGTSVETLEDFVDVVHPEDRQQVREALEHSLETGEPKHEEIRISRDGEVRWLEAPGKPVSDGDGPTRMIGVVRDITDRKQKERELQRQNERLDRFASVVSHDLRNPLNIAQGQLELVREECDSDRLDEIARSQTWMERLIDDLLTLAREGEQVRETEPVALATVAERSWRNVEAPGATLVTRTEGVVQADQSRLQQLLENLFRNAVTHGDRGVTVTVGELDDGFYVADDGVGIPDEEREQVFETGYSTTDAGTGLGLTIVEEIAEAHGWEITVTDSADGGARFEISGATVR